MASKVEIANNSLAMIGVDPIIALSENSSSARNVNLIWDISRRKVLEDFAWGFAIKRKILSRLATNPLYEYTYEYQKPNDCIAIISTQSDLPIAIEGTSILTNDSQLTIRYVSDINNTELFSPNFTNALAIYLASKLAYPLLADTGRANELYNYYRQSISHAKTAEALQNTPRELVNRTLWTDIRL